MVSSEINGAGDTLTVTFSESVTGGTGFDVDGWTLGSATGSGNTRTLSISPTVLDTDTLALDYTPGDVEDAAGNALEAFADGVIENGSTQTSGTSLSETLRNSVDTRVSEPGATTTTWAADIDHTCRSTGATKGVLLKQQGKTRSNLAFIAGHTVVGDLIGQTIEFAGVLLEIVDYVQPLASDSVLVLLEDDAPVGAIPVELASAAFFADMEFSAPIPVVILTGAGGDTVHDWVQSDFDDQPNNIFTRPPSDSDRLAMWAGYGAMSGNPTVFVYEDRFVAAAVVHAALSAPNDGSSPRATAARLTVMQDWLTGKGEALLQTFTP